MRSRVIPVTTCPSSSVAQPKEEGLGPREDGLDLGLDKGEDGEEDMGGEEGAGGEEGVGGGRGSFSFERLCCLARSRGRIWRPSASVAQLPIALTWRDSTGDG